MKKNYGMPAVKNDWQGYTETKNFQTTKARLPYIDELFAYCAALFCWVNYLMAKTLEVERGVLSPDGFINDMKLATIEGLILCAGLFVIFRLGKNR